MAWATLQNFDGCDCAGGGAVDPRIKADIAATRRVFAEWPTPG